MFRFRSSDKLMKLSRVCLLVFIDICLINVSAILALWIRMDLSVTAVISQGYFDHWTINMLCFVFMTILVFVPLKLYNSLWEFAGMEEFLHIILAGVIIFFLQTVLIFADVIHLPRSFPLINALLLIFACKFTYERDFKRAQEIDAQDTNRLAD